MHTPGLQDASKCHYLPTPHNQGAFMVSLAEEKTTNIRNKIDEHLSHIHSACMPHQLGP